MAWLLQSATTRVTTAAIKLPLTLAEACVQMRMETGQDDTGITSAVAAATAQIEEAFGVAMITQTLVTVTSNWPVVFTLSRGPVQSVAAIKYKPAGATQVTLAGSDWAAALKSLPVMISPAYGKTWPSATLDVADPIEVEYVAGFGLNEVDVPATLKQAVAILATSLYGNRESGGMGDKKVAAAVISLLANRRLW